jgi:hypothetical protein
VTNISDLISGLSGVPVFVRHNESGIIHASIGRPPSPYDVCDGVQSTCDLFTNIPGHIAHSLFISVQLGEGGKCSLYS